jgi:cytochrome b subunit of formate dehydrogenase
MKTALFLYGVLAALLLILTGWMLWLALSNPEQNGEASAMVAALLTAFAACLSKMGEAVRAMAGAPLPPLDLTGAEVQ